MASVVQHTIHYDKNINELRQCCFDSGSSLTGFVLLLLPPVSLISMASVIQIYLCACSDVTSYWSQTINPPDDVAGTPLTTYINITHLDITQHWFKFFRNTF